MPVTADGRRPERFAILFVCTGNACRSVIAEHLARREISARLGYEAARFGVTSAGTASPEGFPMHPYTAKALAWLGADAGEFSSHRLTAADIDQADLVLAACREHRDQVVALRPRASRRSYLLREFARLAAFASPPRAASCPVQRACHVVAEAARLRGRIPYVEPAADEIADPALAYPDLLGCAQVIDTAVREVLGVLCAPGLAS
jgi:protein-tyrosine phosphatase